MTPDKEPLYSLAAALDRIDELKADHQRTIEVYGDRAKREEMLEAALEQEHRRVVALTEALDIAAPYVYETCPARAMNRQNDAKVVYRAQVEAREGLAKVSDSSAYSLLGGDGEKEAVVPDDGRHSKGSDDVGVC